MTSRAPATAARASRPPGSRRPLAVLRAGLVPYAEGLRLQDGLVARRRSEEIPDTLVVLEHPHVITLGSSSDPADVLLGEEQRGRLGIQLFRAGRGGGVTYHGPGQLVVYPILDLKPDRKDLHAYLRDLERVLSDAALRSRLSARAREASRRYDVAACVEAIQAFYDDLLAKAPA